MVNRFRSRIRRRTRRLRRTRALKKRPDLREFVYLDDVSVFSLIASQLGPIATDFTNAEAMSLQGEISGGVNANIGVGKIDAGTRLHSEHTRTSQVVRRSIIQNTFRELRDHVTKSDLVLNATPFDVEIGAIARTQTVDQLRQLAPHSFVGALERGQLIEVDVELEADPIFKVNAAVSAVAEILQETRQLLGEGALSSITEARTVERIINRLLTGLVPVRGRLVDYSVVEFEGERLVVRSAIARPLAEITRARVLPLYLVGVASEALFWKDVRLVLFSRAKYRVMCRLAHDGIQERWTPSKLVEVLSATFPDLGEELNQAIQQALTTLEPTSGMIGATESMESRATAALVAYGLAIAGAHDQAVTAEELISEYIPHLEGGQGFNDLSTRRIAFASVAEALSSRFGLTLSPVELAPLRSSALFSAGLDLAGNPIANTEALEASTLEPSNARYLETQIVAIYW